MLAGLIFATEDAESHGEGLAATLPFGGMTLLEYQARLLVGAGAAQLLVAVSRVTPALLGSVARITRRGVSVDVVRSAGEATAKAHPLADIVVIADGLVTTDAVVSAMAGEPGEAVLVTGNDAGSAAIERIDADHHWAGVARISARQLSEIAALPNEYDFQSTLLRVAVQTGAEQILLPASAKRAGHGVERSAGALATRSNAVLAALANQRTGWADRFVFTPITRLVLPQLVRRSVPDAAMVALGATLMVAATALIAAGRVPIGAGVLPVAVAALSAGSLLSWLRGNERLAMVQERLTDGGTALAVLALGGATSVAEGHPTAIALAVAAVAVATIGERVPVRRRAWFATAAAQVLIVVPIAIAGYATIGLAFVAAYAVATLAGAVEAVRQKGLGPI